MKKKPTKKVKRVKAWAVITEQDGEICHVVGSILHIHTSNTLANMGQKVVPVLLTYTP